MYFNFIKFEYTKGVIKSVILRIDNTMAKQNRSKWQTMVC